MSAKNTCQAVSAMPETCSRKEFADRMGWSSPSHVSNLIREGQVVLTEDRKKVLVAESIARIEAARDPSKRGVRERHERARSIDAYNERPDEDVDGEYDYQESRAKTEHFKALKAEAEYNRSIGLLLDAGEVHSIMADVLVTLRTSLEPIGAIMSPRLAASKDEIECKTMIDDRIAAALSEASRKFALKGKQ